MTEAKFSFTTKVGQDLLTVRGDSYDEFLQNAVCLGTVSGIGTLIAVLNGDVLPAAEQHLVQNVEQGLGGNVVQFPPQAPSGYVPQAAPVQQAAGDRTCAHGLMVKRSGVGQKGEWRAWFCPTPKGTQDQCQPKFADKRNPAEWNAF